MGEERRERIEERGVRDEEIQMQRAAAHLPAPMRAATTTVLSPWGAVRVDRRAAGRVKRRAREASGAWRGGWCEGWREVECGG